MPGEHLVGQLTGVGHAERQPVRRPAPVDRELQRVIVAVAVVGPLRDAAVAAVRTEQVVGQRLRDAADDVGRIQARRLVGVAVGTAVDRAIVDALVPRRIADVGGVADEIPADVALHARAPVVDRRRIVLIDEAHRRRRGRQRARQQLRDGRVVGRVGVEQRRQLDQVEDVVVVVAVVEHAGATADRGLAVAGHVPRKPDARRQLERVLRLRRPVEHFHAVDEVAGARHQPPEVDEREDLPVDRVLGLPALRRRHRGVEQRRLIGLPDVRTERRHLVAIALGRGQVVEAQPGVDGEVLLHAPVVLHVPLGVHEQAVRIRVAVGLLVLGDGSEQRVRKSDVGVERVRSVGVERQRAVVARRTLRRAGRVLDEQARLHVVRPGDLGDVAGHVPQRVEAEERPAIVGVERPDRSRRAAGERGVRQDPVRVRLREELRESRQHDPAVVARPWPRRRTRWCTGAPSSRRPSPRQRASG